MSWLEMALEVAISIFQGYTLYRYCNIFMQRREGTGRLVVGWLLYYGAHIVLVYTYRNIDQSSLTIILAIVSVLVVHFALFYGSICKKILFAVLYYALGMCAEIFAVLFMNYIGITEDAHLYSIKLLVNLILFIVIYGISIYYDVKYSIEIQLKYNFLMLFIPTGSILITDIVFRYSTNSIASIYVAIIIIFFNMIMFTIYSKIIERVELQQYNMKYKEQIDACQNHLNELGMQMKDYRRIVHDLKHQKVFLQALLNMESVEEMKEHIRDILGYQEVHSLNIVHTGNIVIDSILNYKYVVASTYGIQVNYTVQVPDLLSFSEADLSILIGNAFDNAIEACEKVEQGKRKIELDMYYDKKNLVIEMLNSYNESDTISRNGKWMTNKQDKINHGIGISSMEKIANRYKGYVNISSENSEFRLIILLYDPKEDPK
ncbi:MAG: GHKL domain-containing protein [Eubacteriales bacterium]